jgi:hypothetical protein
VFLLEDLDYHHLDRLADLDLLGLPDYLLVELHK